MPTSSKTVVAAIDSLGPLGGPAAELESLVRGDHSNPHAILGGHPGEAEGRRGVAIRAFHPGATSAELILSDGARIPLRSIHPAGVFAAFVAGRTWPFSYRVRFRSADGESREREDPYRFLPTLGELDLYLIGEGTHYRLWECLGAHPRVVDGVSGVSFAVWAPNAVRVSVIGEFNHWDGLTLPMRSMGASGIWELFVPGLEPGTLYKYEVKTKAGDLRVKTDPLAFAMELRPQTAGIIHELGRYRWGDAKWIKARARRNLRESPMAVYEVHLGSFMRNPGEGRRWLTYREAAPKLVAHAKKYGFTHLEFMPLAEHPLDESWGYQVTGYYAPTHRYGSPDDLKYLVDLCHRNGLGVLMDWVPAHFPKDDYSLRWFDGTPLYEHADPRLAEHPDWGTLIFNYGRTEVKNFLLANALFWLDEYHLDGLRVDAVASMLYLDYSRQEGEWVPNRFGGRENLEAVDFLRQLNEQIYSRYPGAFTVAEESTAWPAVSQPTYLGGLGFGFKWNMGWMHDSLLYFSKEPVHRKFHHNDLTFSMLYAYTENFILPLSHDEVVHGKGSLLGKMPGDEWQKFANLRLLYAYLFTHPGKKLLFMGSELAPDLEWNPEHSLPWHLAEEPMRQGLLRFLADLGRLYRQQAPLWKWDHRPEGFRWIDCQDADQSVVAYLRLAEDNHLVVILNLTPVPRYGYRIGVPRAGTYRELLNTDSYHYGGSNLGNAGQIQTEPVPWHLYPQSFSLTLPPLAALILEPETAEK